MLNLTLAMARKDLSVTLTRSAGLVHSHAESIYTGLVGKFRAIIAGQRLEDHVPIAANLAFEPLQSLYGFAGGFVLDL